MALCAAGIRPEEGVEMGIQGALAFDVETFLHWAQGAQAVAAVFALIVGGIWTYLLFVRNRLGKPSAKVSHQVTTRDMGECGQLVHVGILVQNQSTVLIKIREGEVRLIPVLPLPTDIVAGLREHQCPLAEGMEIDWPVRETRHFDWRQAPREIEPRESDTFYFDFVVDQPLSTFEVYSYFKNVSKRRREIGWNTTSIHDVPKEGEQT
jgi:hypothetical protein